MQCMVTQPVNENQGERVDVIRTASEEDWGVFLRKFKRCVSPGKSTVETAPLCARRGLNSVPSLSPYQNQPERGFRALQLLD